MLETEVWSSAVTRSGKAMEVRSQQQTWRQNHQGEEVKDPRSWGPEKVI